MISSEFFFFVAIEFRWPPVRRERVTSRFWIANISSNYIQVGHWWYKSCRPWTWISAIMLYTYFILCICIYSPLCVVMYVTRAAIWISSARPMANVWCHPFTFLSSYDSSYIATFHNTSIKTRFWNINLGWPLIDISTPYTIYILLSATIYSVNAISLRNERAWITFMNLAWFSFFFKCVV